MASSSDAWLAQHGATGGGTSSSSAWLAQFGGGGSGAHSVAPPPTRAPGSRLTGNPSGGIGILQNLGGQIADTIHSIPNAVVQTAEQLKYDFGKGGTESLSQAWNDPRGLIGGSVKPQVEVSKQDANALRKGDWHYFEQHPLNPILDVAAIASLGGKGALIGAKTGALGERAQLLATTDRTLQVGDHSEILNQSATLQGRARQRAFDAWSQAHPDVSVIGGHERMLKILNKRVASMTLRAGLPVRAFQRLTNGLTPPEVFAFHVGVEGVPLDDRIAYYQRRLAEGAGATRYQAQYLQNLMAPDVRAVLENPRPEFTAALHAGSELEAKAGERLVAAGSLTPETRIERAGLPQMEMMGHADLTQNLVHPDFPAPYRFPHVGKRGTAGLFSAPKVEDMRGKARPLMQLRHNAAIRLRNAIMLTDPTSVLSTDYLQTMRHEHVLQMQHEALDPISQPLSDAHVATGFKHQNEWYYRPSYDRKQTAPIPRSVAESEAFAAERARQSLGREQMVTSEEVKQTSAQESAKGVVSQNLSDLGVAPGDLHNLEKLNAMGIRRVPAAFGRDFTKEFGGTHRAIRLFYDRPLDVWRAITLNYRPAWAVNNFIGNALMGLATYGPEGAAAYLHVLLATERGDDKVLKLWNYTKRIPTLRRKYAGVFQEVAPELHSAGLFGTQTRITHPGVYEEKLARFQANPAIRAIGLATRPVTRGIMAVGRGITKAEVLLAEDTGREAAFIREAGGDIAKVRAVAKKMGEGNLSLAESLKRLDRGSVERAVQRVNDALGDFNDLSHTERAVLRRIIPFYSWYKVITKVSAKYAARYPARVLLLKNIAAAQNASGEPALPEWLRGSILIGGQNQGVQTLISTQGINPYETINQTSTGGPGGLVSPFITPLIIGATGRDPTFGGLADYRGLGATKKQGWAGFFERAGGSAVSGLAPFRVAQQTTQPYQGKLYSPHTYGHVGPVSINDFLLQYMGLPIRHVNVAEARKQSGLK